MRSGLPTIAIWTSDATIHRANDAGRSQWELAGLAWPCADETAAASADCVAIDWQRHDAPAMAARVIESGRAVIALVAKGDVRSSVTALQLGALDVVEATTEGLADLPGVVQRAWAQQSGTRPDSGAGRAAQLLARRNRLLAALNEFSLELASVPFSSDMFAPAANKLRQLSGAVAVSISTYDPASQDLLVRHVSIAEQQSSVVVRLLGRRLEGMRLKVSAEMRQHMLSDRIGDAGSLAEVTFGVIPPPLAALIEKALGIGWFTGVALQENGELIGTMILAGGLSSQRPSAEELESFAGVTSNALKRWMAEQAVVAGELRYRLMAENMRDVIWQTTPELVFTYVSSSATKMFGYTSEQMLGTSVLELVTEQSARELRALLSDAHRRMKAGEPLRGEPFEAEMICQGGARLWVEVLATPSLGPRGELVGFVGVTRDIEERKRDQDALQRSEETLRAFVEQSADGLVLVDEAGQVERWNDAVARMTGVGAKQALGVVAAQALSANAAEGCRARMHTWLESAVQAAVWGDGAPPEPAEWEYVFASGIPGHVRSVVFPVRIRQGARIGIALQDITALKRAEAERRQLAERIQLASKQEAMGRLAGGVAHEFNNLLTTILGNIELALVELGDGAMRRETLNEALEASRAAAVVTRQLLAFSRRQVVEARVLDVHVLVAEIRSVLEKMVGQRVVVRVASEDERLLVRADPTQLEQILVNLVVNAAEAMPDGGEVLITTRHVVADVSTSRRHNVAARTRLVVLEVRDSGIGMTEAAKQHLFEPFFTTKTGGHGTGLGLAAMYGIVRQAGGFVEVQSEPDKGTTVTIFWPAAEPQQTLTQEPSASSLPGGSETILVVEDEPSVRSLACRVLRRAGYRIFDAGSGEEALQLGAASQEPVDLLLTDVVMPGINGRTLAERWRALHPESKVLFTSGHAEDTLLRQGVVAGQMAFIGKPYTLEALARRVRAVLDGQEPARL